MLDEEVVDADDVDACACADLRYFSLAAAVCLILFWMAAVFSLEQKAISGWQPAMEMNTLALSITMFCTNLRKGANQLCDEKLVRVDVSMQKMDGEELHGFTIA